MAAAGRVVGLVSHRALIGVAGKDKPAAVRDIMDERFAHVAPDAPIDEARQALLDSDTGCLLVLRDDELVGIVTERDLLGALG